MCQNPLLVLIHISATPLPIHTRPQTERFPSVRLAVHRTIHHSDKSISLLKKIGATSPFFFHHKHEWALFHYKTVGIVLSHRQAMTEAYPVSVTMTSNGCFSPILVMNKTKILDKF